MRLVRFHSAGQNRVGVRQDKSIEELAVSWREALERVTPGGARDALPVIRTWALEECAVKAPLADGGRPIYCLGLNYIDHGAEVGDSFGAQRPTSPVVFVKQPEAMADPHEQLFLDPALSREFDWEVELAVIIGRAGRDIAPQRVAEHIAGYSVLNDITARDAQREYGQWHLGKNVHRSSPFGPWVTTADEVAYPPDLWLTLAVNGVEKQRARTSELIFDIPTVVSTVSRYIELAGGGRLRDRHAGRGGFHAHAGQNSSAAATSWSRRSRRSAPSRIRCADMSDPFSGSPTLDLAVAQPIGTSVQRAVLDRLRSDILRGRIEGGARLHQTDLAKAYGVSITPVREALRDLASEGLVDFTPYSGAVAHQPTLEELEQVYEIRSSLTPLAVSAAIQRITAAELSTADELVTALSHATSPDQWIDGNRRLHHLLDDASRNPHLTSILRRLADLSAMYVNISMAADPVRRPGADDEHRALVAAYRDGDVERAVRLTIAHFHHTLTMSRAQFAARGAADASR